MKSSEYAIVDIETTGGNAASSRITEIAIVIHDGTRITQRWQSLVNPERQIPLSITTLTGISDDMVRDVPVFSDIAQQVFGLLHDRIFVAHNVNFDYSFIRHELERAGMVWQARKLCTVRAARKVRPGLRSYALGNLCQALEIPIMNRHRAGGDADATVILFEKLLAWDMEGVLQKMLRKTAPDQRLPPNVPQSDFDRLPQKPGVYYFHNESGKVVYVGKAINLKKRVASHFTGNNTNTQRQNFLRDIYGISFEVCATELMALLLECAEIKSLWPVHNRALKRFEARYGIYDYEARSGYRYLAAGKLTKFQTGIRVFNREHDAIDALRSLAIKFEIDYRFCKYGTVLEGLAPTDTRPLPDLLGHNDQVAEAIAFLQQDRPSFAIIDKGRDDSERSCIWVENGEFYGMGYIASEIQVTEAVVVKDYVVRYKSSHYTMQLVHAFAAKYPARVVYQNPAAEFAL